MVVQIVEKLGVRFVGLGDPPLLPFGAFGLSLAQFCKLALGVELAAQVVNEHADHQDEREHQLEFRRIRRNRQPVLLLERDQRQQAHKEKRSESLHRQRARQRPAAKDQHEHKRQSMHKPESCLRLSTCAIEKGRICEGHAQPGCCEKTPERQRDLVKRRNKEAHAPVAAQEPRCTKRHRRHLEHHLRRVRPAKCERTQRRHAHQRAARRKVLAFSEQARSQIQSQKCS